MKLEEQLLPHVDLQPTYDQAIWVYVYRTFKKDDADRLAERISLRFGVTSWPQLFLADPSDWTILAHTGRTTSSFLSAFARTKVKAAASMEAHARLQAAEARAKALEKKPKLSAARKALDDEDIVVRTRALEALAEKDPDTVVARSLSLLQVPSDPFRFTVCKILAKAADPKAARALEALVKEPKQSLNPNVLRIRAVQALATCGDAASVAAIAPHASSGIYFNGLTGVSISALVSIRERHPKTKDAIEAVLRGGYPKPPDAEDKRAERACLALAKRIHKALGAKAPFPEVYDEEARARLMESKR